MPILKYFRRIEDLQKADAAAPKAPLGAFDFASLGTNSRVKQALTRFILRRLVPAIAFLLRQLWPNLRIGRVVFVTRAADVEQVLRDPHHFAVVYAPEMVDLGGGANNVLGLDGAPHDEMRAILERAMTRDDIEEIAKLVREDAEALLAAGRGRIDVMRDLVSRTAAEATCAFFGLNALDPDLFGEWTMAVSNQLFADFGGDAHVHAQAKIASAQLGALIDDAILRIRRNNEQHPSSKRRRATLIDRLVTDFGLPDGQVRATIIGLATAFVPTNTLAAGNMLEVLFDNSALMTCAMAAAKARDRQAMREVLLEAGRLDPALSPGLWRTVPDDVQPPRVGDGWRARQLRRGDLILACIPSALRDGRGIANKSDLAERRWMMFGAGPHVCWGAELALAHLVSVFIALLAQKDLRRAGDANGTMFRVGPYPVRLDMTYEADDAGHAMVVIALPVRSGVLREDIEQHLDKIGNPIDSGIAGDLTKAGRLSFLSLSVIETEPGSADSILLVEASGDGTDDGLIDHLAATGGNWLREIIDYCRGKQAQPLGDKDLAQFLKEGFCNLKQTPWGTTGLHFDGLPGLSVKDIERQAEVADFARKVLDSHMRQDLGLNSRAMEILLRTKRLMRGDSMLGERKRERALEEQAQAAGLRSALMRPGRTTLAIADWKPPSGLLGAASQMLIARENRWISISLLLLYLSWVAAVIAWLFPAHETLAGAVLAVVASFIAAVIFWALVLALPTAILAVALRWKEIRDIPDERAASLEELAAIAKGEDRSGTVQNHIIAVMPFKKGLVRRITFALAMWGIRQTVTFLFRPGFVSTIGTIHKARWLRVQGTNQFVFFSNYDGTWESYLEDFVTRAHQGQSAAWSHGLGFPATRWLIFDGAADGDRFKRWVRLQQRPTRFWYSRFPQLTAQQIRNNAMIEDGLARASSDTDARNWLASFGSAQRGLDQVETQEVQSLLFSGFSRIFEASALLLRLPEDPNDVRRWLEAVSGLKAQIGASLVGPPERWLHRDGSRRWIELPEDARIMFGERSQCTGGTILGLTAQGLERCGLAEGSGLESMPAAFRLSMARRAHILGDDPEELRIWRFSDEPGADNRVDAILLIYGAQEGLSHQDLVTDHSQLLAAYSGSIVGTVSCVPVDGSLEIEPFRFRDGISQPTIKGTRRAQRMAADRDLVAAGEFLLGYRNQQDYLPPPICLGAELDPECELPTVAAPETNRYPRFGRSSATLDLRDFGRNGTFLAVRQLQQDVAGFWKQASDICAAMKRDFPDLDELAGDRVSAEWVAAKIIGRWPDGTPLVGNEEGPTGVEEAGEANDFAYGSDDPQGLACPLGAHIRRANPRDSQEPGDPSEQRITNRHRLIRRGRAYRYGGKEDDECGLLFMALCADLERQFEFVQRTWINATNFHGLVDERDPLLGRTAPGDPARSTGHFTIPTAAGPLRLSGVKSFVTTRGGAYFFLPSRSALAHLVNRLARSCGEMVPPFPLESRIDGAEHFRIGSELLRET